MCRLLGYATSGFNLSLNDVLGESSVAEFRELSEIHNDGWGVALLSNPSEPPFVDDGGAPTPETGTKLYKSTLAARHDPIFNDFAADSARGGLWHLRLASSNLPLILENQQPFFANGLSFIHNGDISDERGVNIVLNRAYPVNQSAFLSTGGRSDSAIFFSIILEYISFGFALDEAVAQAVRQLRQEYPKSSYNCMIQSQDQLVVLCAAGREKTSPRIVEIYDEYGKGEKAHDYRVLRYRDVLDRDGKPAGVVAGSSGFPQDEADGWKVLENNQMIVASNRTGEYHLRTI
ncbi:class II glutamine amidotransferase [Bifidobacterium leontopitheci]|uniref:Class II glutamine amidotransferase n=1 Tax=Bifidobacterium leontopitheci TaxID=2650774 RepID=A0A6I1GJS0_9BIFI|nr:class II glutamine amidotransferase [Bifidobacterium leontopitheci]KAB7789659.1 class II glutamine amidotransferase [Bifidobacterium leontopitheci]